MMFVEMNNDHPLTGSPTPGARVSRPPMASENVSDQAKTAAEWHTPQRRGPLTFAPEVGGLLFSIAILAFGIEHLVFSSAGASNMYPWLLGSPAWNYAFGALLITLSVSIGIKKRAPLTASVLGTILCLYGLCVYVPRMFAHLRDPGPWTDIASLGSPLSAACELLAMGGAAWVLAGTGAMNMKWMARLGRVVFAATLVAFGAQHFLYSAFLATLIPSWIPWHLFWEDLVGAAFVAAAAAIATNKAARLAAFLLGTMFALFVLVLHVPRVVAAVGSRDQWTSGLVAVAMSAGSFILSGASKRSTEGRAPARGTTA